MNGLTQKDINNIIETLKKLGDEPDISEFVDEELVWELSYQLKIYADFLGDDEING